MPMANPRRGVHEESMRIQEHTGGFRPREMMGDYDVNPNEDSDGLSHYNRQSTASEEMREQLDPKARKKRALREMEGELPHVSLQPEEIGEVLNGTPMMEQESELLESAMGVDMGHASNGIGISQGANVGPVRREGPGLIFGRSNDAFEDAWSLMKQPSDDELKEFLAAEAEQVAMNELQSMNAENPGWMAQGFVGGKAERLSEDRWGGEAHAEIVDAQKLREYQRANDGGMPPQEWYREQIGNTDVPLKLFASVPAHGRGSAAVFPEDDARFDQEGMRNVLDPSVGEFGFDNEISEKWQEANKSDIPPTLFLSDIVKGKRKKRGRKYEEDDESDEDEKKSKKKRKRKRKRQMKRGKKEASRQPHTKTKRRAGNVEQNISRNPREQAFAPRRMMGANPRASGIPLRIRDPVAYQRKLASEKFRRQMGALPRGHSAHADTRGITGEKVQTIGMGGKGTKLPHNPMFGAGAPKGISLSQFKPNKAAAREAALAGEPLGGDPLTVKMDLIKRATLQMSGKDFKGLNRSELLDMKRDLKRLLEAVAKLSKSSPELDWTAKRGAKAGGCSDPGANGATKLDDELQAPYRFEDPTILDAVNGVTKR
jgi:hypothetical protein